MVPCGTTAAVNTCQPQVEIIKFSQNLRNYYYQNKLLFIISLNKENVLQYHWYIFQLVGRMHCYVLIKKGGVVCSFHILHFRCRKTPKS